MALPSVEDVHEALLLVGQLNYRPDSHYAAAVAGGPQFIGWGDDRYLAADIRDVLFVIAAGLGGKKVSQDDLYPRPEREPDVAATVAEFDIAAFARRLAT